MRKEIPGFWKDGPHEPFLVEAAWREFVRFAGGKVVEDLVPEPRNFQNADFIFPEASVVAELKEIETEFSSSPSFLKSFDELMRRVVEEDPDWRPLLFGGDGTAPPWFNGEFLRIFRPPISRILKKANNQIKETKAKFDITSPNGVLFLVNDGFTSVSPLMVRAVACHVLSTSYSSIDALVYLTVNRYVEIEGSDVPRLLWLPSYGPNASDELVSFIDQLGRQWFEFLEAKIGPFTSSVVTDDDSLLRNAQVIHHPELPKLKK